MTTKDHGNVKSGTTSGQKDRGGRRPAPHEDDRNKKHIEINLGMACNNRCIFCVNTGKRKSVPYDQALKDAADHAALGYNSVGFIGGDPTVYPRIADLGAECVRMGYRHLHIITNGRRLSDGDFLDKLISAGYNRFSVSIHSHRADAEDRLTGTPGGFDQKLAGIKNLLDRFYRKAFPDRVSLNIVLHKFNLPSIDSSLRFFSDIGVTDYRLLIIRPEGRALENWETLVPTLTAVRKKLPSVIRIAQARRLNVMFDPPPFCLFHDIPGFSSLLAVDYLDDIVSDNQESVRARGSWNNIRRTLKTKFPFCAECRFDPVCEGVWKGYAEKIGTSEFHPVK